MSESQATLMKGHAAIAKALVDNGFNTMFGFMLGGLNEFNPPSPSHGSHRHRLQ